MWALSVIPDNLRAAGGDIMWVSAFVVATTTLCAVLWRLRWLRAVVRWPWRMIWGGRDEHGQWQTPSYRATGFIRGALREDLAAVTTETKIQLDEFRAENGRQHVAVGMELGAVKEALANVQSRQTATEDIVAALVTRVAALEAVIGTISR